MNQNSLWTTGLRKSKLLQKFVILKKSYSYSFFRKIVWHLTFTEETKLLIFQEIKFFRDAIFLCSNKFHPSRRNNYLTIFFFAWHFRKIISSEYLEGKTQHENILKKYFDFEGKGKSLKVVNMMLLFFETRFYLLFVFENLLTFSAKSSRETKISIKSLNKESFPSLIMTIICFKLTRTLQPAI